MLVDENKRSLISSFSSSINQQFYISALLSVSLEIGFKPPMATNKDLFSSLLRIKGNDNSNNNNNKIIIIIIVLSTLFMVFNIISFSYQVVEGWITPYPGNTITQLCLINNIYFNICSRSTVCSSGFSSKLLVFFFSCRLSHSTAIAFEEGHHPTILGGHSTMKKDWA